MIHAFPWHFLFTLPLHGTFSFFAFLSLLFPLTFHSLSFLFPFTLSPFRTFPIHFPLAPSFPLHFGLPLHMDMYFPLHLYFPNTFSFLVSLGIIPSYFSSILSLYDFPLAASHPLAVHTFPSQFSFPFLSLCTIPSHIPYANFPFAPFYPLRSSDFPFTLLLVLYLRTFPLHLPSSCLLYSPYILSSCSALYSSPSPISE